MPPEDQKQNIQLPLKEVYPLLCEKCQLVLKKLLAEKIAEKAVEG
jgi:hypothetical protein